MLPLFLALIIVTLLIDKVHGFCNFVILTRIIFIVTSLLSSLSKVYPRKVYQHYQQILSGIRTRPMLYLVRWPATTRESGINVRLAWVRWVRVGGLVTGGPPCAPHSVN